MAARTILIGLGNPIMSDDAVGLAVAKEVLRRVPGLDGDLSASGGFDVLDCMIGYERAVIIDSMVTGRFPPGTVRRVDVDPELKTLRVEDSHGMDFLRAMEVGRVAGANMPREVIIYGIEVADASSLGESISEGLREMIDEIAEEIAGDLRRGGE
jgi:hydrogenase maturation protease